MIMRLIDRFRPAPPRYDWEDYFTSGETLLWSDAPVDRIEITAGKVFLSAFGLPFFFAGLACAAIGLAQVFSFDGIGTAAFGLLFFVFGLPFIAVGAGLSFGIWIVAAMTPKCVRYALSDRRAYVAQSYWHPTMESYPITANANLALKQGRRGDTVSFAAVKSEDSDGDKVTKVVSFENIADGAQVYGLLRDVQARLPD